jgi:hypothetical protein
MTVIWQEADLRVDTCGILFAFSVSLDVEVVSGLSYVLF